MNRTMPSDAFQRSRLSKQIVKLVAPKDMSYAQYVISCTANGIMPSVEDGAYLHWLICQSFNEPTLTAYNVIKHICKGLEKGWLLDKANDIQQSYFLDACVDVALADRSKNSDLYEAFFTGYKDESSLRIWKELKRINNVFAFSFKHISLA